MSKQLVSERTLFRQDKLSTIGHSRPYSACFGISELAGEHANNHLVIDLGAGVTATFSAGEEYAKMLFVPEIQPRSFARLAKEASLDWGLPAS